MRLHTYLPKNNTADKDGLLSTSLTEHGWEKYIGRTGKTTKEDVLDALDKWQPGFKRRYAISALSDAIPKDAHKDFRDFADAKHHYSFETKDLIKAKILDAIQETNQGRRGTHPVEEPKHHDIDWKKKPRKLLFSRIPHYLIALNGGKIPPGLFRDEEKSEKVASTKIDIVKLYNDIRRRYRDIGFDIKGDKLVISEQPTYMNGNKVPLSVMKSNESGGNVQSDGTIRINPMYRSVMRHFGLKGSGSDFIRKIIGHEMGHHIDFTILSKPKYTEERKKILDEIKRKRFHTIYTDSYGKHTDKRKLDKELIAEYLSHNVTEKNGQAVNTIHDEDALRIDNEARMSGRPALRAPSKSEWMNRIRSMWSGDKIRDTSKDNQEPISPITDAVVNTGSRIHNGQYVDALNGVIAGLTEAGSGLNAGGGQRYNGFMRNGKFISLDGNPFGLIDSRLVKRFPNTVSFYRDIYPGIVKNSRRASKRFGGRDRYISGDNEPRLFDPLETLSSYRYSDKKISGSGDSYIEGRVHNGMIEIPNVEKIKGVPERFAQALYNKKEDSSSMTAAHEFRHVMDKKNPISLREKILLERLYGFNRAGLAEKIYNHSRANYRDLNYEEMRAVNAELQLEAYKDALRKHNANIRRPFTIDDYERYISGLSKNDLLDLFNRIKKPGGYIDVSEDLIENKRDNRREGQPIKDDVDFNIPDSLIDDLFNVKQNKLYEIDDSGDSGKADLIRRALMSVSKYHPNNTASADKT